MGRIELPASPLPRECSTTELHGRRAYNLKFFQPQNGAGEGNRTLVLSLEGFSSTIELHPLKTLACSTNIDHKSWWREKDSNLRRQSRQIYSLIPLTAWVSLRFRADYYSPLKITVKPFFNHTNKITQERPCRHFERPTSTNRTLKETPARYRTPAGQPISKRTPLQKAGKAALFERSGSTNRLVVMGRIELPTYGL